MRAIGGLLEHVQQVIPLFADKAVLLMQAAHGCFGEHERLLQGRLLCVCGNELELHI
jgi:hypothetical protein